MPRRVAAGVVVVTLVAVAALAVRGPSPDYVVRELEPAARVAPSVTRYAPAPRIGVTGSIALPAVPVSVEEAAAIVAGQPRVAAAPPVAVTGITARDRARALDCLTAAIYYEAATEGDAGQAAVAQVVLNRVRHPAFPASVCGVVYQGSERHGCQFSFACDGATGRAPNAAGWARAARTAARALTGRVFAPVGLATHYHTFAVTPVWNRSLVMTDVVGAHFFHRWKGYWGTGAVFRQRYRGAEPAPGPHQLAALVLSVAAIAPATTPAAGNRPAVTPSPTPDRLPPASSVLDRWKDSGKPLDSLN